jgi:hypothetical protein
LYRPPAPRRPGQQLADQAVRRSGCGAFVTDALTGGTVAQTINTACIWTGVDMNRGLIREIPQCWTSAYRIRAAAR